MEREGGRERKRAREGGGGAGKEDTEKKKKRESERENERKKKREERAEIKCIYLIYSIYFHCNISILPFFAYEVKGKNCLVLHFQNV